MRYLIFLLLLCVSCSFNFSESAKKEFSEGDASFNDKHAAGYTIEEICKNIANSNLTEYQLAKKAYDFKKLRATVECNIYDIKASFYDTPTAYCQGVEKEIFYSFIAPESILSANKGTSVRVIGNINEISINGNTCFVELVSVEAKIK